MDTATVEEKNGKMSDTVETERLEVVDASGETGSGSWKPWALVLALSILVNVGLALGLADTKGQLAEITGRLADAMTTEEASQERYAVLSSNIEGDQRAMADSRAVFEKVQRDLNGLTTRVAQIQAEAGQALETLYAAERSSAAEDVSAAIAESEQAPDSFDSLDSLVKSVSTLVGVESSEESPADVPPAESVATADLK